MNVPELKDVIDEIREYEELGNITRYTIYEQIAEIYWNRIANEKIFGQR